MYTVIAVFSFHCIQIKLTLQTSWCNLSWMSKRPWFYFFHSYYFSHLNIAAAVVEGCRGKVMVWFDTAQSWGAAGSLLMGWKSHICKEATVSLFSKNIHEMRKAVYCVCYKPICYHHIHTRQLPFQMFRYHFHKCWFNTYVVLFCCVGVITL